MQNPKKMNVLLATIIFVLGAIGTKVSFAYWASAVTGNNHSAEGDVITGTWERYFTGTAISSCSALRASVLQVASSATFHLTQNIDCSSTSSPSSTTTFSGILYGNGFTISNYTITSTRRGLFYNISGAQFHNLILDNIDVGSSSSRASGAAGILAATTSGANNLFYKLRIYNSSVYVNSANGAGGIIGRATYGATVSNAMLQNVIVNNSSTNSSSGSGGIFGRLSATASISDVYVEGSIVSPNNSGGLVGVVENPNGILTADRIVTYGNTSYRSTTQYAGGVVGRNNKSGINSLTDLLFTGALYAGSSRAGTIYNNTAMAYTNAWAAEWEWDNTPAILYTAMTGTSANYSTNYVDTRAELTTTWWSTNIPNIASSGYWTFDSGTSLYELKPRV